MLSTISHCNFPDWPLSDKGRDGAGTCRVLSSISSCHSSPDDGAGNFNAT